MMRAAAPFKTFWEMLQYCVVPPERRILEVNNLPVPLRGQGTPEVSTEPHHDPFQFFPKNISSTMQKTKFTQLLFAKLKFHCGWMLPWIPADGTTAHSACDAPEAAHLEDGERHHSIPGGNWK